MRRVYGQDTIAAVATVHDIRALQPVAATYQSLLEQFGDVLDWYAGQLRRRARNSSSSSEGAQQEQQPQVSGDEAPGSAAPATLRHGRKKAEGDSAAPLPARKVRARCGGFDCGCSHSQSAAVGIITHLHHQYKHAQSVADPDCGVSLLVQVTVLGPSWGQWGIERYGMTPSRVDALEYYPQVSGQDTSWSGLSPFVYPRDGVRTVLDTCFVGSSTRACASALGGPSCGCATLHWQVLHLLLLLQLRT